MRRDVHQHPDRRDAQGPGVDIEFVKPETGAIAFYTTMHIVKGAADVENAYKYIDIVARQRGAGGAAEAALQLPPGQQGRAARPTDLPMKTLDEMAKYVHHDWAQDQPAARRLDREVQQGNGEVSSRKRDVPRREAELARRMTARTSPGRACDASSREWQLALPLALAFAALFLAPLLLLVGVSFFDDDKITQPGFASWAKFFGDPFNCKVIVDTLLLGAQDGLRHRR